MLRVLLLLIVFPLTAEERFINPVTEVCWECLFPITISGVNVSPGSKDQINYSQRLCACAGTPPKIGIPLSFWEPLKLVEVTRHAYKMVGLGGISLGNESIKNRGSVGNILELSTQHSFYHAHLYHYPILSILGMLTDFSCLDKGDLDIGYMSEFDPLWNDDELSAILNPEAALFGNPLAHLACIADCTAASFDKPLDELFWCAGCEGSLYPFTGTVSHHTGSAQASSLIVQRLLAKEHRMGVVKGYEKDDFCEARYMPIIKKSLYKTQLLRPKAQTSGQCHSLGKSDLLWGLNKTYPTPGGDDFVYLIWVKKQCCLDAVKPAITGALH